LLKANTSTSGVHRPGRGRGIDRSEPLTAGIQYTFTYLREENIDTRKDTVTQPIAKNMHDVVAVTPMTSRISAIE
jgi:hypothetical protein